jgi:hypothetical protein
LSESSIKEKPQTNGKKRKLAEEESDSGSDDDDDNNEDEDDDDDDDGEDENEEIDTDLKNALEKVLGNAVADEKSDDSDLDDETMLKLDDTIAQAFKMRTKDKREQKEIIQYKSRVLDFIQELFKSTQRLDLTTVKLKRFFLLFFADIPFRVYYKCFNLN